MSLKSKIEAVIYASEEPVTLPQLAGLLGDEAEAELQALADRQTPLPLNSEDRTTPTAHGEVQQPPDEAATETALPNPTAEPSADAAPNDTADSIERSTVASSEAPVPHNIAADNPATQAIEQAPGESSPEPLAQSTPDPRLDRERERRIREHLRYEIDTLIRDYADADRGIEVREVAGGFRMGTKPEYHDAVRGFVKSLKPALKLTLQALETLAVVAYKQPVTAAEISEIRGVDSSGVLGGLMARKLIATAGRKQVIGRPMLYKTTREFLICFGLKNVQELPSMEEFERLASELNEQEDLPMEATDSIIERTNARGDADHIRDTIAEAEPDAVAPDGADAPEVVDAAPLQKAENIDSKRTEYNEPAEPGGTADDEKTSIAHDHATTGSDDEALSRNVEHLSTEADPEENAEDC